MLEVRWVVKGRVHYVKTNDMDTARDVANAMAVYWCNDLADTESNDYVCVWRGHALLYRGRS